MKIPVICCYCSVKFGEIEPGPMDTQSVISGKPVASHGICPACYPMVEKEVDMALARIKANKTVDTHK